LTETTTPAQAATPSAATRVSTRRLYRSAGIAALIAAAAYLFQPIVVFVVQPPIEGAGGYPIASDLFALRALVPAELAVFTAIGVATVVLALAVFRLHAARGAAPSLPSAVGVVLGVIAGFGWMGAAAGTLTAYGLYATNIAEITDDTVVQQAAIQAALLGNGMLSVPVLAMSGWFALLATSGRRAGIVGWPLAVLCFAATAIVGGPALILLLPFGALALIPVFAVLGIAFLVKSRRSA